MLGADAGPGGVRVTADPVSGPLIGVSATAQSDGRYAVDLSLVADMVPLPALAEEVRARVRTRAGGEQLEDVLGAVNVEFASVLTAEEFAAAAAERDVEEAILAEELAAGVAIAEEADVSAAPENTARAEAGDAVAGRAGAGAVREGEQGLDAPGTDAALGDQDATAVAAALAARQAALATDQAALAAKQATLAAELAALAGERAARAASRAAVPSLGSEPAGSVVEDEERET